MIFILKKMLIISATDNSVSGQKNVIQKEGTTVQKNSLCEILPPSSTIWYRLIPVQPEIWSQEGGRKYSRSIAERKLSGIIYYGVRTECRNVAFHSRPKFLLTRSSALQQIDGIRNWVGFGGTCSMVWHNLGCLPWKDVHILESRHPGRRCRYRRKYPWSQVMMIWSAWRSPYSGRFSCTSLTEVNAISRIRALPLPS